MGAEKYSDWNRKKIFTERNEGNEEGFRELGLNMRQRREQRGGMMTEKWLTKIWEWNLGRKILGQKNVLNRRKLRERRRFPIFNRRERS